MRKTLSIPLLICAGVSLLSAQLDDVDALARELDLSILETPSPSVPAEPAEGPADHLFLKFPDLPAAEAGIPGGKPVEASPAVFTLPAATYLVVPNPPRMDGAYDLLARAVRELKLETLPPLKVILHADGNFSVALRLKKAPEGDLPPGLDLSPLPEMTFVGVMADIQLLRKEHPPVLNAYLELRKQAENAELSADLSTELGADSGSNLVLDRQSFCFFPIAPGKVWFALRVLEEKPEVEAQTKRQLP